MKNIISLEERKKLQLEILVEIDRFCREKNIKYMLAFGTLLGAIRHKGYIPWDDDIDISMPIDDMLRFKNEFKSETLQYCDVDTVKNYPYHFSRVSYKNTYAKNGLIGKEHGVCIDLYPTIEVSSSKDENDVIVEEILPIYKLRLFLIRLRRILMSCLPIKGLIGSELIVRKYRDMYLTLFRKKGGGAYHSMAGPLTAFDIHTFNFNPFEDMVEVDFEGRKFMAPIKYHQYLIKRYGDYMQLPPEDQRHPYHGNNYYWK